MSKDEEYEIAIIHPPLDKYSRIRNLEWKTKDGQLIRVRDLDDNHLRNIALMLMGMGYVTFKCETQIKINWLTVLRMEWEERQKNRALGLEKKVYRVQ